MDPVIVIAILVIILTLLVWTRLSKSNIKYPPGPRGLPIVGNVLQCSPELHLTLQDWAKKYGSIFSIKIGFENIVVIDDHKMMREVFSDPAFSGRPQNDLFLMISGGSYGIIVAEGKRWEAQRRFTLKHLKDFGFGRNPMESLINEEVKEVVEWLRENVGKSIDMHGKLNLAVLNSLWAITSGTRFSQNDPRPKAMLEATMRAVKESTEKGPFLFFAPWIRHVFPRLSGWNSFSKAMEDTRVLYRRTIKEHIDTFNPDHIRDFIDNYLLEIKDTEDKNSSFYGELGYKNLHAVVGDLFHAGAETSSQTMTWAILYLSTHLEIQQKLHEEIDRVVGNSRLPSLADRPKMPYLESTIFEVLRKSSFTPLGAFHTCTETKEFHGYTIPKGTWLIGNLYSSHFNKEIWGDPENFRPERFLSPDGTSCKKHDALIAFLVGRRACIGEPLAKDTLFLFLAGILQQFRLTHDGTFGKPDFNAGLGFVRCAKPYRVIVEDRFV